MKIVSVKQAGFMNTASRQVIDYVCRAGFVVTPYGAEFARGGVGGLIWTFIVWIRVWLGYESGGERPSAKVQVRQPAIINRQHRLMARRKIAPVRNFALLFHLCGRHISRSRFTDLMCRISLFGRVDLLGLRSSGTVLQRRALLVCYDHGWWRAPIGDMGRVNGGLWRVHLWPN